MACRAVPDDALPKLFGLANDKGAPGDRRALARGDESLCLRQREAHLLKELDDADCSDSIDRVPPMPGNATGGPHQPEFVIVAQRRGRDARSSGEIADREEVRHATSSVLEDGFTPVGG
jgi:hypothetical protein